MAINKNHEFEDLNGVKCAIVEKNVSASRVEFLKKILEYNGFTVVVVGSPPPKAAPATATAAVPGADTAAAAPVVSAPPPPSAPETFTLGVTDVTFNSTNAIFGRLLHAPGGHVVTLAYWNQQDKESN